MDWDQQLNEMPIDLPFAEDQFLLKLEADSDFEELYNLRTYPREMIVKKDSTIYHFGQKLS